MCKSGPRYAALRFIVYIKAAGRLLLGVALLPRGPQRQSASKVVGRAEGKINKKRISLFLASIL